MEWSREYLQRHNIHRIMEDCVEDLVVEQPSTNDGIVKTITQRLETIRRRFDFPQQRVVLVLSDPFSQAKFRDAVDVAANSCGASIVDGKGLRAEDVRDLLVAAADKAFILNFPGTVGDAIAFEGCFGKPHRVVMFEDQNFVKSVKRNDAVFSQFASGPNAVAELYNAKQQLVKVSDASIDAAAGALMTCIS
jgi:hypothetical protein